MTTSPVVLGAPELQSVQPHSTQDKTTEKTTCVSKNLLSKIVTGTAVGLAATAITILAIKTLPLWAAAAAIAAVVALPILAYKGFEFVQERRAQNALIRELHTLTGMDYHFTGTSLIQKGLLTSENFLKFQELNLEQLESLQKGLNVLKEKTTTHFMRDLQSEENFEALLENPDHAEPLAKGFRSLDLAQILTEENRESFSKHAKYAETLGEAFSFLKKEGILSEDHIRALLEDPQDAEDNAQEFKATKTLEEAEIATVANKAILLNRTDKGVIFAKVFNSFPTTGLNRTLFDQIADVIVNKPKQTIPAVAQILRILSETEISTEKTHQALFKHLPHAANFAEDFDTFATAGKLTEESFIKLIESPTEILSLRNELS